MCVLCNIYLYVILEIKFKLLGSEHLSVASSYSNMGLVLRNMAKYQEELDMYSK